MLYKEILFIYFIKFTLILVLKKIFSLKFKNYDMKHNVYNRKGKDNYENK